MIYNLTKLRLKYMLMNAPCKTAIMLLVHILTACPRKLLKYRMAAYMFSMYININNVQTKACYYMTCFKCILCHTCMAMSRKQYYASPLSRDLATDTALHPLIWCSNNLTSDVSSSPKELCLRRHRYCTFLFVVN